MPKLFLPEAVRWELHVLNRSLTVAVKEKTPEECWSGEKPNVKHFRIFGCIANVHIPDKGRINLDDKSYRCVFLGVSEESKAYRLYDPTTKKVIVSRVVVFDKNEGWNWRRSDEDVRSDVFTWVNNDYDGEINDYYEKSVERDDSSTEGFEKDNEVLEGGNDGTAPGGMFLTHQGKMILLHQRTILIHQGKMIFLHRGEELEGHLDGWKTVYGAGFSDESMCFMVHDDPICFDEVVKKEKKWRKAMDLEMEAT
jgi:hypothetical protein